jgi:aminoglycoside phosphotransferase (APT) family kinase protein
VDFDLTTDTVGRWLDERGLAPTSDLAAEELPGGVSATVIAVRAPGTSLVVKQALPRLRVADEWLAKPERAETEAAAMRACGSITPGAVPAVLAVDPGSHILAMELVEDGANWQAEIAEGRAHTEVGTWAGDVLGRWHAATAADPATPARFPDFEAFEQLRLRPFHETVMKRRPDLAPRIAPYVEQLRGSRSCLVHGDFAMKNILVSPTRQVVLDFEVAHAGNPVFDLAFFLSFAVLSAVRWPGIAPEMQELAAGCLSAYATAAERGLERDDASVTGHTACLVLSRTDGKSPALFFDEPSRGRAREVGLALLERPEQGLWSWA